MNFEQLEKQAGKMLKLRPLPIRVWHGQRLPFEDDDWQLVRVEHNPKAVEIVRVASGHVKRIEVDNLQEFRSPHFLILKCQLVIDERGVHIEPLADVRAARMRRLRKPRRHH